MCSESYSAFFSTLWEFRLGLFEFKILRKFGKTKSYSQLLAANIVVISYAWLCLSIFFGVSALPTAALFN
jgi:hypothetical protein